MMKTFLKILAGFLIVVILLITGLNLYFNDERLKSTILPVLRDNTGADVQVETMSLSILSSLPNVGFSMQNFMIPTPEGDTVATAGEIIISIEPFSLFGDRPSISSLSVNRPDLRYIVREDSTTNIDFLMPAEEEPADTAEAFELSISAFGLNQASILYEDRTTGTTATLRNLTADLSLEFGEVIQSTVDAELESLGLTVDGSRIVSNLSLGLNQTSTLDLENERLEFTEGGLSVRGLQLNMTGNFSDWSSESPRISMQFSSSSDNFGELLRLAPEEYSEQLAGLETRGSLAIEGTIDGTFTEESLPQFNLLVEVNDGFLQNPDLPQALEEIRLRANVSNELATVDTFSVRAGENRLQGSGRIEQPLEENALFELKADGDINLATVGSFYPLGDAGIEEMGGRLTLDATANGSLNAPEDADFSGSFVLAGGMLKYADVPQAIEQINARLDANQNRIRIDESGFTAAGNRLNLSGTINSPFDEDRRSVDILADADIDLGTVKEFYPLDEDSLRMSGELIAEIALRGQLDPENLEQVVKSGSIALNNGYLFHYAIANPLENVTLLAEASGPVLTLRQAEFTTDGNSLSATGTVNRYLSEEPVLDVTFTGGADLATITEYADLGPTIQQLSGSSSFDINVNGPVADLSQIVMDGSMELSNVNASGDSLILPVSNLSASFTANPERIRLEQFFMNLGESDIQLDGDVRRYMSMFDEDTTESSMPLITGSYRSDFLDIDEMIDWEEESSDEPYPIFIPDLLAEVDATIGRLRFAGVPVTEISGSVNTTSGQISVNDAVASLFEGQANGTLDWTIDAPLETGIRFSGLLDSLRADAFFRDTQFLGPKSTIHRYVTGAFSSDIDYSAELLPSLTPDITTADANGTFKMSKVSLKNHPIQQKIAEFLKTPELSSLTLDSWNATITMQDTVMTLSDLNITSRDLGMELNGELHMLSDEIDYKATLLLPERFRRGIATILSGRAADALQLEDGRFALPIRITGTTASPVVRPDRDTIDDILKDALEEGAKDVINRLFGN